MKMKSMKINNFRCYYGIQKINFDIDDRITIVYGNSGAGKSTLLHFINWVLYGKNPPLLTDTKPLYNMKAFEETEQNGKITVEGQIDFIHENTNYSIKREAAFIKKGFSLVEPVTPQVVLRYEQDGNWDIYETEKIKEKINSMIPEALSKYFFFYGESKDDQKEENRHTKEMTEALFSMFDLKKYESALKHLGDVKGVDYSVKASIEKEKRKNAPKSVANKANEINDRIVTLREQKLFLERVNNDKIAELKIQEEEEKKFAGFLSQIETMETKKKLYYRNKSFIEKCEQNILNYKKDIGINLYNKLPYFFLGKKSISTKIKFGEMIPTNKNTLNCLHRDLLEEILKEDNKCICGRKLDDSAKKYINSILKTMPPESYEDSYNKFVKITKQYMNESRDVIIEMDNEIKSINEEKYSIAKANREIENYLKEKAEMQNTEEISRKLKYARDKIFSLKHTISNNKSAIEKRTDVIKKLEDEQNNALKNMKMLEKYENLLYILSLLINKLKKEYSEKRKQALLLLEKTTFEVYLQLSTRKDLDENVKFFADDLTPRNDYKSGGQRIIDTYTYIIGVIKALQELELDKIGKEFPIIIDAPFSNTDKYQMGKFLNTIPKIVPQTILFTIKLTEVEKFSRELKIGNIWKIQTLDERQEVSQITRGN